MEGKHKSLLVINESTDAHVTLNLYLSGDTVCWLPHTSKVIKPKNKLFHTSEWGCKLKLVARFKEQTRPKKVLLKPQQWVGKKLIRITDSLDVVEDDLANHPEEEKKCLREKNRDEELDSVYGRLNLYSILSLDMKEVRAMSKEEQDEEITSAFHRELQIWQRRDDGDDDIVREVIMAYDILQDREKRARYNNLADYDKGWLSVKRFKAVFWPECETVAQRLAWMKRMGLLALVVGLTVGGILSVVLTAGFSSPLSVTAIDGGLNSLRETISKEAVLDGCDVKKWLMSTGVGYVLAVLPGGAALGVALLSTSTALTVSEVKGIRIAISAGCGIVSSLGSDAKKRFIDGEKITLKQALGHAACKCAAAAAAKLAGGAVARVMSLGTQTIADPTANVEGAIEEIGEQVSPSPLHDKAKSLAQRIPVPLTAKVTKVVIEKAGELAEKHLDDPVEVLSSEEYDADGQQCTKENVDALVNAIETNKPIDGIVKCISNGDWYSGFWKMVVSYSLNSEITSKEVRGNGKQIKIPYNATKIEVRFEIWRPPWGDILKYDRFQRCWCEPYERHVFQYESPPIRTFTIDGFLWWKAVMRVTDEHHDETNEI